MVNHLLKTNYPIRTKPYWNFVRATPATYLLVVIILFLGNPNKVTLYLLVSYIVLTLSVPILKEIVFKPIYMILGKKNDKIPLLGYGRRPNGATDCGAFLNFNNKLATSFGMPSGHSQLTWMVATYLLCHLYFDKNVLFDDNNKWKKHRRSLTAVFSSIIVLFAISVSYSRVNVEYCHTLQQVVIGGLIGIGMGAGVYFIQKKFIE
jgi:membrane-associated phospholipid phosphatase